MDLDAAPDLGVPETTPVFADRAEALVTTHLQKLNQGQLKNLLGVSDDLARWHFNSCMAAPVSHACAL